MGACCADVMQTNLNGRNVSMQRLDVVGNQRFYPFGRCRQRRVIDLLWCFKAISDGLEPRCEINLPNSFRERCTIAKQQTFKFVHKYEWYKPIGQGTASKLPGNIAKNGLLYHGRFVVYRLTGCRRPTRPSAVTTLRQPIVVDHCRCDAVSISLQMPHNIALDGHPRSDAASPTPLACISDQTSTNIMITVRAKVVSEHLFHKRFLSFTLHVN
jgi:hypothetical protein